MLKKIIAAAAVALSLVMAPQAVAAQPKDLDDVRFMVSMAKVAWMEMDREGQASICAWWYIDPVGARNELARGMYYDVYEMEYSRYDTRRAAYRFLNWAC